MNWGKQMARLKLTEIAAIAEVIGTFGIIMSLVFVGVSINRNSEEVRASQMNELYTTSRQIYTSVASDPERTWVILQGRSKEDQLSDVDKYRYDVYLLNVIDLWDQLLARYDDGLMDGDVLVSWDNYFHDWARKHITNSNWQRIKWQYEGLITEKVEAAISAI